MVVVLSYKYRIYPDKETESKLVDSLDTCRWLYNRLLEECMKVRQAGTPLRMYDCHNLIPELKKENPRLDSVYSKVLQMVSQTLWGNIKGLSELKRNGRRIGKLRFKGEGWYKTLNFNQSGFKVDTGHYKLSLSKIGEMRINLHRPLPPGKIKGIIIKKEGKRWYAVIQIETNNVVLPKTNRVVGIDVGVKSFVVDSDANSFENPKFLSKTLDKIKKAQQGLSRKKKGSNNRFKAKEKLAKLHDKVNNQRNDFAHKLSRYYINNYDTICVEDLDVKGLKEKGYSKGLHLNIHDAAWSRFLFMLSYKAESAGKKVVKVDPRGTTQKCANCGETVSKELKDRIHDCPYCGLKIDRDYNSALNILILGLEHAVMPVELRPLRNIQVTQVLAMNWEAPSFRAG